jgi:hypothetical protein
MDFVLSKFLLIFVLSNLYLGTDFDLPRHDLLILNNGEEIKCQVQFIADGMVKITTNTGERTIVREINVNAARDLVEAGIIKTTRYSGRLTYFDAECLELQTSSGTVKIKKGMVRKIVISQEPSFDL